MPEGAIVGPENYIKGEKTMRTWRGFTVVELAVALAIVFILVAVAVASFSDHMTRKARFKAQVVLLDSAAWLLQQYVRDNTFLQARLPDDQAPREGSAVYRISLAARPVASLDPKGTFPATTAQTFTIMAVPIDEDACGTLLIDQTGRRGITGSDMTVEDCWQ